MYPVRIWPVPEPYLVQALRYGANTDQVRFGYREKGILEHFV